MNKVNHPLAEDGKSMEPSVEVDRSGSLYDTLTKHHSR